MSYDESLQTSLLLPPIVAEMREVNHQLFVTCRERLLNSFDRRIIEKIASRDKISELNQLVESCFQARHGAHILGVEAVYEADEKLFLFLDSICFDKFSSIALSKNIDAFYQNCLDVTFQWQESPLAVGAVKTAASAEAHR